MNAALILFQLIGVSLATMPSLPCSLVRTRSFNGYSVEEPINECFVDGSYSTVYTCIDTNKVQVTQTTGTSCDGSLNSWYEASDGYSDNDNSFSIRCTVGCVYTTPAPTASTSSPTGPPSLFIDPGNPNDCLNVGHSLAAWYDGSSVNMSSNTWFDKTINQNDGYISTNTQGSNELFNGFDGNSELYLNGYSVLHGNTWGYVWLGSTEFVVPEHTVFNVCKYKVEGSKGRILQSTEYHAAYGFFNGASGVAFENSVSYWDYITINGALTQTDKSQFGNDWVISSQRPDLYRGNGRDFTINNALDRVTINSRLSINTGKDIPNTNDQDDSDWACSEVIIANDLLDLNEITCVEQYLSRKYDIPLEDECRNVLKTNVYGINGYTQTTDDYTLYQGKITGINSWGIGNSNPILYPSIYLQWESEVINESLPYGATDYLESDCIPFTLDNDDYINGFRVKYRSKINGLAFYTAQGEIYECFSDVTNSEKDTGAIVTDGHYLSGFEIYTAGGASTDTIYSIRFQFTSLIDTCNIHERYVMVPSKKSWADAQGYCVEQFNTNLATVSNADELMKVTQIRNNITDYKSEPIWVGLTDVTTEGNWLWIDGTDCVINNGTCTDNWAEGEPNNWDDMEHCAELTAENVMNDANCDETRLFFCNAVTLSPTLSPVTSNPTQPTESPTFRPTEEPTLVTNTPTESPSYLTSDAVHNWMSIPMIFEFMYLLYLF